MASGNLFPGFITFPAGDLSATRQSRPIDCRGQKCVGLHITTPATGTPAGTYTIQGSNQAVVQDELINGRNTPATSQGNWVTLTLTTIHGSSLTVAGAANSLVLLADVPAFIRVVYTASSGGTGANPTIFMSGRET